MPVQDDEKRARYQVESCRKSIQTKKSRNPTNHSISFMSSITIKIWKVPVDLLPWIREASFVVILKLFFTVFKDQTQQQN